MAIKSVLSADHFHDEAAALEFIEARLWPNGPVCPICGETTRSRTPQYEERQDRDVQVLCLPEEVCGDEQHGHGSQPYPPSCVASGYALGLHQQERCKREPTSPHARNNARKVPGFWVTAFAKP